MDCSPSWERFWEDSPCKGDSSPQFVVPTTEGGWLCTRALCWLAKARTEQEESAFGSTGMGFWRRGWSRRVREAQGVSLPSHHPSSHPSGTSWSRAHPPATGGRLRVRSESTKMGILFFWASFCYGDSFAMGILSRNSFHTVLPLSPLGQQFHLPGVSM